MTLTENGMLKDFCGVVHSRPGIIGAIDSTSECTSLKSNCLVMLTSASKIIVAARLQKQGGEIMK